MSNVAHNLSPAEREERRVFLDRLKADFPKPGAVIPMRRQPLGLAPAPGDDEPPEGDGGLTSRGDRYAHEIIADAIASMSAEARAEGATIEAVFELCEMPLSAAFSGDDILNDKVKELRKELSDLKLENARLAAKVAEATSKVSELAFVSERLRVEARGPAGERGMMGRDGNEGRPGARGERGADGRPGSPGPRIIGWETVDESFVAMPLLSDGRQGASLHLRGMFEAYHSQTEGEAAEEEAEAAVASRRAGEDEAERVRWGLPSR